MLNSLQRSAMLPVRSLASTSCRNVSSKYPRPTPRPYKRRLMEAALQPILPKEVKMCTPPGLIHKQNVIQQQEYTEVELALSNLVKKWIISEEYRVLAICQFLPVAGRTLWFSKNQLRLKGLEFRNYSNKVLKKVFEGTPLSSLEVTLVGSNAILAGKDLTALKVLVSETDKLNWIVPLVVVADSRILSMKDVRQLAELNSLEDLRAQTVQILTTQLGQLPQTLDASSHQLVGSLTHLSNQQPAQ